ncbi:MULTISPECIES: AAA family ATPase [Vibrio]|uniref:AAA family ATPase n=1 Tax=Vibrio TaxID=662 RepID=UPI000635DECE|nr:MULTISPECIES: AAA family ATPase [Vibrio]OMO23197.1 ATPase [Vibrio lentus]PMN13615.1 ATPase [Vibrio lentus]CDT43954.1 ATPase, possibly involved in inorganic ion transport [Vibrio coralliirubri]
MNAVESIVEWSKDKPVWWNLALKVVLEEGELNQNHIDFIFNFAKSVEGLEPKHPKHDQFLLPIDISGYMAEENSVRLSSLSQVEGVAALAEEQTLDFRKDGLTIVYGDNGAGKSSYTSILKHACLTRGALKPITSNVFTSASKPPQALLTLEIDETPTEFIWSNSTSNNNAAKSIRVFDTSSAHHYLSNEDALGYKPVGLNLITELTKAVESIKNRISEEVMGGNGFVAIPSLNSQSKAALFLNQISELTNEADIELHCATTEEIDSIKPLQDELVSDMAQSPEQIRKNLIKLRSYIAPLLESYKRPVEVLGASNFDVLKGLELDYQEKKQVSDTLRQKTLSKLPFDNVGDTQWTVLWGAAKDFLVKENKGQDFPPTKGDSCPLCLQDIQDTSADKLKELEAFLNDKAAKGTAEALKRLTQAKVTVKSLSLNIAQFDGVLNDLDVIKPGLKVGLEELNQSLINRQAVLSGSVLPESLDGISLSHFQALRGIDKDLFTQIEELEQQSSNNEFVAKKQARLTELTDRAYIAKHKANIITNVRRSKRVAKLNEILGQCATRSISTLSAKIYSQSVIEPLKESFVEELKSFGFNRFNINVKTRNKAGQQQFKLELANSNESVVGKVASEGEQRCIAIASFLSEMKADSRKSAVLFDDPVNSLSHQWSAKVAKRLIEESLERQVIVFTHDIVFYKLLLEASDSLKQDKVNCISLERSRSNSGIVRTNPPWDALPTSKRMGVLTSKLQNLRKIDATGTETEFREAAAVFYSFLREAWERLVEEKLLNKVVSRFERGVHLQRLSRLDDITDVDLDLIYRAHDKCCIDFIGHDTAAGIRPCPTIDEVVADFDEIKEYLKHLQIDRKRT